MSLFDRLFGRVNPPMEPPDSEEPLVPVFMPSLTVILTAIEQQKGAPLSEAEVLRTRDEGACIMMRLSHARQLSCGSDLNPENIWAEWQQYREGHQA